VLLGSSLPRPNAWPRRRAGATFSVPIRPKPEAFFAGVGVGGDCPDFIADLVTGSSS
jgi:hypothetical protein